MKIDITQVVPTNTSIGRKIILLTNLKHVTVYTPESGKWGGGRESKRITLNRFVLLDDLFFEGFGLWIGEGGKSKGLYFGNMCPELLLLFLNFAQEKFGLDRLKFKVMLNVPSSANDNTIKEKWSETLQIPIENFTAICVDPRINREYAQLYVNSVVLIEALNALWNTLKPTILTNKKFASAFLRGVFAAEGQVALKKWGTLFYVSFSSSDENIVIFLKKCFEMLGITSGKYMSSSRKFPIYGYRSLKRFKEFGIHTLHPEKREKFERGFASYKRVNVLDGEEARVLILQQLASGPKTYDDLATALGKARTTIQAWHIPILKKRGLIKRAGKRGQAWLWTPAEGKSSATAKV